MPQPLELILHGAPATGGRRAILARATQAWLQLGGDAHASPGWHDPDATPVTVAELRDGIVRLLVEEDDARLLVWVPRDDLRAVIAEATSIGGGVDVAPGTPFVEQRREGNRIEVAIAADGLQVTGWIDAAAIGDVWEAADPAAPAPEPTHTLAHSLERPVVIRAAPDAQASAVATAVEPIDVRVRGPVHAGWVEIETLGAQVRARGFVPAAATSTELGLSATFHGGRGYGMSHAMRLDVPAGTCLRDRPDGEVIGVVTTDRNRFVYDRPEPGWWSVVVDTPWGLLHVPARADGEPLVWARCVP